MPNQKLDFEATFCYLSGKIVIVHLRHVYFLLPHIQCGSDIFLFTNILFPLSTVEIISEDSILKWYREAHSPKGKMHFLEKMRPFMEWLQNAEEGKLENVNLSKNH